MSTCRFFLSNRFNLGLSALAISVFATNSYARSAQGQGGLANANVIVGAVIIDLCAARLGYAIGKLLDLAEQRNTHQNNEENTPALRARV